MNILLMVTSFLLIFALFGANALKNAFFLESEKRSSCGSIQVKRALQSKYEKYKYRSFHQTMQKNEQRGKQNKIEDLSRIYYSHRKDFFPPTLAKMNLFPLIDGYENQKKSLLYEVAARLLYELYGHTSFWEHGLEYKLLDAMLCSPFCHEASPTLSQLFPQTEALQKIFYKVLKGSTQYDVRNKTGYPPLRDFFYIDPEEPASVCFPFASYPVLVALFQEKLAHEILEIEHHKWEIDQKRHTVTQQELRSLLTTHSSLLKGKSFQEFETLLSFTKKRIKLETIQYQDKDSSIHDFLVLPSP